MRSADVEAAAAALCAGGRVTDAVALEGGVSAFVARLRVECATGDGHDVVFRQHSDRAQKDHGVDVAGKEYHLLRHLHQAGFEVPRPLALHGPDVVEGPWLVVEWLPGSTTGQRFERDDVVSAAAGFLARLHAVQSTAVLSAGLGRLEDPVTSLPNHLADDPLSRSIAEVLDDGVDRHPNPEVVVHGDYWPGNLLFDGDVLVGVLDWEDAGLGDPLADLAGARVELVCAYGDDVARRFTDRYVRFAGRVDLHDLDLWDVYVAATALRSMHRWGLPPADERSRRAATSSFCAAAVERLRTRDGGS